MALNKVLLIGNVGKDPDVRHLEGGASVATFTLATTERYKDKSGDLKEITEWHTIVCWRQLAELAEKFIKKGSQIFVEGRIRTRSWDDQQSGAKRYATEIMADTVQLLGKKSDAPAPAGNYTPKGQPMQTTSPTATPTNKTSNFIENNDDEADDLPF